MSETVMTTDRRDELNAVMSALIDAEIKRLVEAQYILKTITGADVKKQLHDLSEIAACIGTAHRALNMTETADLMDALRESIASSPLKGGSK